MKKVTCENGHFYDADRFELCPICGQGNKGFLPNPAAIFKSEETVPLPPSTMIDELASTAWIPPEEMRRMWGDDAPIDPMAAEPPEQQENTETDVQELPRERELSSGVDESAPTMWIEPDPSLIVAPEDPTVVENEVSDPERIDEPRPENIVEVFSTQIEKSIPAQADKLGSTQEDMPRELDESVPVQTEKPISLQVNALEPAQMSELEPEENEELIPPQTDTPTPTQTDEQVPAQADQSVRREETPMFTNAEESVSTICETAIESEEPAQSKYLPLAQAVALTDAISVPVVPPEPPQQKTEAPAPYTVALPVGWLVGLSGENKGRLFPCKSGRNRIGQTTHMDIVIPKEPSVDLDSHAQLIYEPKKRQFFLQVGNGDGLSYINDELVFTHRELHAYDRITLGDAEFIFLPLCGENFDWNMNTRGE